MNLKDKICIYPRHILIDERGWFLKLMTGSEDCLTKSFGEIYITHGNPFSVKGKHFHPIANEWFTCIDGEAKLTLEDINTHERMELILSSSNPQTIYVPSNIAHTFCSINDLSFTILAYADCQYDPSDTIMY